jgi:hypothetical protein
MRQDHVTRGFQFIVIPIATRQFLFLFQGQNRYLVDLLDVRIEATRACGNQHVRQCQFFAHLTSWSAEKFTTKASKLATREPERRMDSTSIQPW